jgi:hypothetical protein
MTDFRAIIQDARLSLMQRQRRADFAYWRRRLAALAAAQAGSADQVRKAGEVVGDLDAAIKAGTAIPAPWGSSTIAR